MRGTLNSADGGSVKIRQGQLIRPSSGRRRLQQTCPSRSGFEGSRTKFLPVGDAYRSTQHNIPRISEFSETPLSEPETLPSRKQLSCLSLRPVPSHELSDAVRTPQTQEAAFGLRHVACPSWLCSLLTPVLICTCAVVLTERVELCRHRMWPKVVHRPNGLWAGVASPVTSLTLQCVSYYVDWRVNGGIGLATSAQSC